MTRKEKYILCHEETIGTIWFYKVLIATLGGLGIILSVMGKFCEV